MESLFDSEEEEEEGEEEKEGDETWRKALVEEVYTRKVKGKEPQDMILSLMGGHHSLWVGLDNPSRGALSLLSIMEFFPSTFLLSDANIIFTFLLPIQFRVIDFGMLHCG